MAPTTLLKFFDVSRYRIFLNLPLLTPTFVSFAFHLFCKEKLVTGSLRHFFATFVKPSFKQPKWSKPPIITENCYIWNAWPIIVNWWLYPFTKNAFVIKELNVFLISSSAFSNSALNSLRLIMFKARTWERLIGKQAKHMRLINYRLFLR